MKNLLQIQGISKSYDNSKVKNEVLDEIDYTFYEGKFYTITGKSGSGKSTLLHILSGLCAPTKGEVIFLDKKIFSLKEEELSNLKLKYFGFIFQAFHLLPELCALENILLPVHLSNKKVDQEYLNQILIHLNIEDLKERYPFELSGGEQQRIAIARAMINKPSVIFADEPTGNLDEVNSSEVIQLLLDSQKKFNQTIILVTHDLSIAKKADIQLRMKNKKIHEIKSND